MATRQSVFEIGQDFRTIREAILSAGGECPDEVFNSLKAIRMTAEEKLTQCYFVLKQWEVEILAAKEAADLATNHMRRRQKSIDTMKERMVQLATELEVKKLDTPHCRFSIVDGRTTLNITDLDKLPAELVEVVITETAKPKKDEIEKLMKAGTIVTGAEWKTGDPYIRFTKPKGDA